jgi:hypothetical protein
MSLEYDSTTYQEFYKPSPIVLPSYHLYENKIVISYLYQGQRKSRSINDISLKNLKKPQNNINISRPSRMVIRRRVEAWCKAIQAYNNQPCMQYKRKQRFPVMLTVTLSAKQIHSDQEIKKEILQPFLKQLQRVSTLKYYFWKAEKQKNGNIHFHILIDTFIYRQTVQKIWNSSQENLGYISRFNQEHKHREPPSTQIMAATNWYTFYRYMLKYITKDEEHGQVKGRKWYMSERLKTLDVYNELLETSLQERLMQLEEEGKVESYSDDWFTVIFFNKNFDLKKEISWLSYISNEYYIGMYKRIYDT